MRIAGAMKDRRGDASLFLPSFYQGHFKDLPKEAAREVRDPVSVHSPAADETCRDCRGEPCTSGVAPGRPTCPRVGGRLADRLWPDIKIDGPRGISGIPNPSIRGQTGSTCGPCSQSSCC
ncbi:unnamed protein product [Prorocentrum cordatum]|uniref:Uncharacterized protein n=1 Tax=Prorocentrum cordatum TaxID=2364126 RepID=A0ABN9SG20_9DINO|nr:unnamed protein product [Polarella glacialis]